MGARMISFPVCPKCEHKFIPLSDFGPGGATMTFKSWACINPACQYQIAFRQGVVEYYCPLDPKVQQTRQTHVTYKPGAIVEVRNPRKPR